MFSTKRFFLIGSFFMGRNILKSKPNFVTLEKNLNMKFKELFDKEAINYDLINSYLLFVSKFQKNLDYSSSQQYIENLENKLKIYEENVEPLTNFDLDKNMDYAIEISKSFQSLSPDLKALALENFIKIIDFLLIASFNLCDKQPLPYNSQILFLNKLIQVQIIIFSSKIMLPSLSCFLSYYEKNKRYMEEISDPIQNVIFLALLSDIKNDNIRKFLNNISLEEILIKNDNFVFRNSKFSSLVHFLNLTYDAKKIELMNILLMYFQENMATIIFPELFTLIMTLYQFKEKSVQLYLFPLLNELVTRKDLQYELKKRENLKMIQKNIGEIAEKSQKFHFVIIDFLEKNKKFLTNELVQCFLSSIPTKFLKNNLLLLFQKHYLEKNKELDWKMSTLTLLAFKLDQQKVLKIEMIKLLDGFLMEKIRVILSNEEINQYITFLHLLGKNGFWESQHFQRIDLFYFKQQALINQNAISALSIFVFGCKSVFTHRVEYYQKNIESLLKYMKNNNIFKLKDMAIFLYSIAILMAKFNEKEILQEHESNFITSVFENIIKSNALKNFKLMQTDQIFGDYFNEKINIEHLLEIYQYLLTQLIFAHKMNLFSCEKYSLKEIVLQENEKNYNKNPALQDFLRFDRFLETLDLKKIMKLKNSNFSIIVRELLTKMGVHFKIEHQIKIYFVDVLIEPNFVIEIQGNKHYTRENLTIKPKTFLKKMHLESLGYKYMEVAFFDFNQNPLLVEKKIKNFLKG